MKWNQKPMDGVMLEEAYQVFGEWDFAILFQADTNENALHFVGDVVRHIEGVASMSTIPISPIKDSEKSRIRNPSKVTFFLSYVKLNNIHTLLWFNKQPT